MIELFDALRLKPPSKPLPQRTLAAAAMLLLLAGAGGWALHLQQTLADLQTQQTALTVQLQQASQLASAPSEALLADLSAQVERAESEAQAWSPQQPLLLQGSQWLDRVATLSAADISLSRIEIERSGAARLDGAARAAGAVNNFVQAWDRQPQGLPLRALALDVKAAPGDSGLLQFQLQLAPLAVVPAGATEKRS